MVQGTNSYSATGGKMFWDIYTKEYIPRPFDSIQIFQSVVLWIGGSRIPNIWRTLDAFPHLVFFQFHSTNASAFCMVEFHLKSNV